MDGRTLWAVNDDERAFVGLILQVDLQIEEPCRLSTNKIALELIMATEELLKIAYRWKKRLQRQENFRKFLHT